MATSWKFGEELGGPDEEKLRKMYRRARQRGQINLSGCGLTTIPDGAYDLISTCEEGEIQLEMFSTGELTKVDFSYNELVEAGEDYRFARFTACTNMRLSHNAIRTLVLPDSLQALQVLDVSNNALTGELAPDGLHRLHALAELNVTHNKLSLLGPSLPASLQVLKFGHNQITALPELITCGSLRELSGERNQLASLPLPLPASLAVIELSHNQLGASAAAGTPLDISNCRELTIVQLGSNQLSLCPRLPFDAPKLTRVVLSSNKLRHIDGSDGAGALDFSGSPLLSELFLNRNAIVALPEALVLPLTSLRALELSENALTDVPYLLGYLKSLRRLTLEGNPIRPSALSKSVYTPEIEGASVNVDKLKEALRGRGRPPAAARGAGYMRSEFEQRSGPEKAAGPLVKGGDSGSGQVPKVPKQQEEMLPGDMGDMSAGALRSAAARATDAERVLNLASRGLVRFPTAVLHLLSSMVGPKGAASALEAVSEVRVAENALTELLTPADEQPQPANDSIDGDEDLWARLSACKILDCSKNRLVVLPEVIRLMHALQELRLGGNRMDVHLLDEVLMPEGPSAGVDPFLAKLQVVDLSFNQLTLLPACLLRAPALHTLNLARNRMTTLGDDSHHMGGWKLPTPSLTSLDLSSNQLVDLADMPRVLANGGAPALAELNLEGNELHAIPHALGSIASLHTLLISGNPQRAIRHNIIEKGSAAVMAVLREMAPAGGFTGRGGGGATGRSAAGRSEGGDAAAGAAAAAATAWHADWPEQSGLKISHKGPAKGGTSAKGGGDLKGKRRSNASLAPTAQRLAKHLGDLPAPKQSGRKGALGSTADKARPAGMRTSSSTRSGRAMSPASLSRNDSSNSFGSAASSYRSNGSRFSNQSHRSIFEEEEEDANAEERAALTAKIGELQDELARDGIGGKAMPNAKRFQIKKEIAKLNAQVAALPR